MGIRNTSGFTIIEVMLFLAVTGALTAALLVGSGIAIGQQRYRDSVNGLESLIQEQYSKVLSISNPRAADAACNNATVVAPPQTVTKPQSRGASDCVIVGRLLTVDTTGTKVTTQNVIGQRKSLTAPPKTTDLAELQQNYYFGLSPLDRASYDVAWGAKVVKTTDMTTTQPLSLLIIRSPLSGSVMTFEKDGVQTDIASMVKNSLLTKNKDVCINGGTTSFASQLLAIRINAYAASQSAVEIPLQSENVCRG